MKAISDEAFHILIEQMELFMVLSTRFKTLLRPMLFEMVYHKGARILNFRQRQEMVWFMLDGLAREIRVNEWSFKERTIWFWFPFSFVYTTPGFFSQQPSQSTIELLKDCRMIMVSYDNWQRLKRMFGDTEKVTEMIRDTDARLKMGHQERINNMNTEERYVENKDLLDKLFCLTKRQYIAEFMGMSLDRLSKLRTKY
ncbi:cAMP-binding domain of CRP or a regulatory subunit of cAMP-dependent protein kinases [Pedobacter steynii]|uniref:cAMP-binding domain of CRP or a regulatory subunit of cAMP-dependent protein kinases n=1 Tax=Pedobacter steynii TaxID=430522 RepID=A0A1G9K3D8_9SPHI|nr:hypothetical protein [Pedobacter steynii]NQX38435.1 hypothetical protein [Pedobacter steynii]SDL44238.1 cAMP-binding domain of CRP or a regulatory subunit of cAMP-dependent protein kinases [Pedobacter steynii]